MLLRTLCTRRVKESMLQFLVTKFWPDGQNGFDRPTVLQTLHECLAGDTDLTTPLCYSHGAPMECQQVTPAAVLGLLTLWNPLAICWRVALVYIFAFKRVARRTLSHVGQKVSECLPSTTDVNSACSVVLVHRMFWIFTALPHVRVGIVGSTVT